MSARISPGGEGRDCVLSMTDRYHLGTFGAELAEGYDCLIFLYYLEHIREAQNYDFKKEGKTN